MKSLENMSIGQRTVLMVLIVLIILLALAFLGWATGRWDEPPAAALLETALG